jgi:hypothetical protein
MENLKSKDETLTGAWLGEVVDVDDPNKSGRIKVKVFGKFDELETEFIPWAYPANNYTGGGSDGGGFFSVPKVGSIVSIKFDNGNIYHPEYRFAQTISQALKDEISDSYTNAHSLIYDTSTEGGVKIFFTESKGLMLDYKSTQINIKNDNSVVIQTESGNSVIEITNDGKLNLTHSGNITVKSDANIDATCKDLTVHATNSYIKAGHIELGNGATENLILGRSFKDYFNNHIHLTPNGPSGKPLVPMTMALLSDTAFTKK